MEFKETSKVRVIWQALKIFLILMLGVFMSALVASSVFADNLTQNVSLNITDGESLEDLINDSVDYNATANGSIGEFYFNIVLDVADFVTNTSNDTMLNISGIIDTLLLENATIKPVFSAVELDVYSEDRSVENYSTELEICYYYVNGTSGFSCLVRNATDYTVVAITDYENETYYRYSSFNASLIEDELLLNVTFNISETYNETEEPAYDDFVTTENASIMVEFEEAYDGNNVTGRIWLNSTVENNLVTVEIWPVGDRDKLTTCAYNVNETLLFGCQINSLLSGVYEINVSVEIEGQELYVYELTYIEAPELKIRLIHEGTYNVSDVIELRSFATLDNEMIDAVIELNVTTPSGIEYVIVDNYPLIEFIPDGLGYYLITGYTEYRGLNTSVSAGLMVDGIIENVSIIAPDVNITTELENVYEIDSEVYISVNVENTSESNTSITITDPTDTAIVYVTGAIDNTSEILYLPTEIGQHEVLIETSGSQIYDTFTVMNKSDFAVERYVLPAISPTNYSGGRNITEVAVTYDALNQTYSLEFNTSSNATIKIEGVPTLDNLTHVQSIMPNDTRFVTEIFAIDDINISKAQIVLSKRNDTLVRGALYCEEWNYSTLNCTGGWKTAGTTLMQNSTHVWFNVTHFTAYVGGAFSDLWIWDISDEDHDNITAYVTELINFSANYSDPSLPLSIWPAACNITFNDSFHIMEYDFVTEYYYANVSFSKPGFYEYNVSCYESSYDLLKLKDNITINPYFTFIYNATHEYGYPANGTTINVTYDRNNSILELVTGALNGTYTSPSLDANGTAAWSIWDNMDWTSDNAVQLVVVDDTESVIVSNNSGDSWSEVNSDFNPGNSNVVDIEYHPNGSMFIVDHLEDVYRSDDWGETWTLVKDDLITDAGDAEAFCRDRISGNMYVLDSTETVWKSTDNGTTWTDLLTDIDSGTSGFPPYKCVAVDDTIFASNTDSELFVSYDGGSTWAASNTPETGTQDGMIITDDGELIVVNWFGPVSISYDGGNTWENMTLDYGGGTPGDLARDANGYLYITDYYDSSVSISYDGGYNWQELRTATGDGSFGIAVYSLSTVKFQVRSDADDVGWGPFLGPDGTSNSYHTGTESLNVSDARYFQYKAYFESINPDAHAHLYNVSIEYELPPVVKLISPALTAPHDSYVNDTDKYVNLSFVAEVHDDENISNCTLWHNMTGTWKENVTQNLTGLDNRTSFNISDLYDTEFVWNVYCVDNASNGKFAKNNWTVILNYSYTPESIMVLEKNMTYNGSGGYLVSLVVQNPGTHALYDITIADFVGESYNISTIVSSDRNSSIDLLKKGKLYYWDLVKLASGDRKVIEYMLITNKTGTITDVRDSYMVGSSYNSTYS